MIRAVNPACEVETADGRLDGEQLAKSVADVDLVVDGSDNFGTRFAINAACVKAQKPLVSGAAIRYEGQVTVFDSRDPASPCYACLYQESGEELENCRQNGVLAPLTGVIGSLMAAEAMKMLTGAGEPLVGRLLRFDGFRGEMRSTKLNRDPACPVCKHR
jgi:adenylyltransferase/sulfurtransferase